MEKSSEGYFEDGLRIENSAYEKLQEALRARASGDSVRAKNLAAQARHQKMDAEHCLRVAVRLEAERR